MWYLLDRLARPALADALLAEAKRSDARVRAILSAATDGVPDPDETQELLTRWDADAALWQLLRHAAGAPRWRTVRRELARQERIVAPLLEPIAQPAWLRGLADAAENPAERRSVRRLYRAQRDRRPLPAALRDVLDRRAGWLAAWQSARPPGDQALRSSMTRMYRRARQALTRQPGTRNARLGLRRLIALAELMAPLPGRTRSDDGPRSGFRALADEGRALLATLDEMRWLQRLRRGASLPDTLSGGDCRRLGRLARCRRAEVRSRRQAQFDALFRLSPDRFAARLPWEIFNALLPLGNEAE